MRYLLIVLLLAALAMGPVAAHSPASAATPNGNAAVTSAPPMPVPPTMLDGIDWDEWLMLDGIDWDEWLMNFLLTLPVPVPIVH